MRAVHIGGLVAFARRFGWFSDSSSCHREPSHRYEQQPSNRHVALVALAVYLQPSNQQWNDDDLIRNAFALPESVK